MRLQILALSLILALPVLGAPLNITAEDTKLAGGEVPTNISAHGQSLSRSGLANLMLLNHLQNLKYALFTGAIANLTSSPGIYANRTALPAYYADPDYVGPWPILKTLNDSAPSVLSAITRISAQDKIQLATTQRLLLSLGTDIITPCSYVFPATSLTSFLDLASLITNIIIGFLVDFDLTRGHDEDDFLSAYIASITAVQARHDSTIRLLTNTYPSPTPLDTWLPAAYAYSMVDIYNVPRSCAYHLRFPVIPPLGHVGIPNADPPGSVSEEIIFSHPADPRIQRAGDLYLAWFGQLGEVVYTPFTENGTRGGASAVPLVEDWNSKGTVYAVLTGQNSELSVEALVSKTLAGPNQIIFS